MIVIRDSGDGRFEVFAEDHHWEVFDGSLGAILAAQGLAMRIAADHGGEVVIDTPWGSKLVRPAEISCLITEAGPDGAPPDPANAARLCQKHVVRP